MRYRKLGLLLGFALLAVVVASTASAAGDNPQPINFTHNNVVNAPAPVPGTEWSNGPKVKTGQAICTTSPSIDPSGGTNINTDCQSKTIGPHNETSIAVNPTHPDNMVGGANDYQLSVNPGGHVGETTLSRAHVTFDGGATWSEYPIYSNSAYQATGDPSVAFDASGHAYYATLGFRFVGPANAQNPDVLVANSGDGGKTWSVSRVAQGSGNFGSVGESLDKEYVAAWGDGNAIVTFGDFTQVQKGAVVGADIYDSVTHDYGKTWSQPTKITDTGEAFGSVPAVSAGGSKIFVSYMNTPPARLSDPSAAEYGRDDYMVQQVDPQTGATIGDAVSAGEVYDGIWDYPYNVDGRQTYQDSQFRTWAFGNITVDPTNPDHLAVVWSDMRNTSDLPFQVACGPGDAYLCGLGPYGLTDGTNSDVVVSESIDGGKNWTRTVIAEPGDQFMPWGAFDSSGTLQIGYFDRSYDTNNHEYGYTVATETSPGAFSTQQVTDMLSDPTTGDRWFATSPSGEPAYATTFLGDYSNIAVVPDTTSVVAYWTDMRNPVTFLGRTGQGEDAYFAQVTTP